MAYNYEYPYTDPSRVNADWLLSEMKRVIAEWAETQTEWTTIQADFAALRAYVMTYFAQLNLDAEVSRKLDSMAADGTLTALLRPYVEAQDARIAVLEGRMDTFASLTEGSTTGDAELIDIRVQYDGHVAETAGDAVRAQAEGLHDEIEKLADMTPDITKIPATGWVNGTFYVQTSTLRLWRAYSAPLTAAGLYYFDDTRYKALISRTNDAGAAISSDNSEWTETSPIRATLKGYTYFRIQLEDKTRTNIDPDTVQVYRESAAYPPLVDAVRHLGDPVYISPDGDDAGDGTPDSPLATVTEAVERGADYVIAAAGTYKERVNLQDSVHSRLTLVCDDPAGAAVFTDPEAVVISSESNVSGPVYKAEGVTVQISEGNLWMYQDGVKDDSTLISGLRLPQERGLSHRCLHAMIRRCSALNLSAAMIEMTAGASSNIWKWYREGSTLYYTRPANVTTANPIIIPVGGSMFANYGSDFRLTMRRISCRYMALKLSNMAEVHLTDCAAGYCYEAGAIRLDRTTATLIRCEACRCVSGTGGDGINAHGSIPTEGGAAKTTTITLVDCWSHDNNDDGFSDHERCESTIIGGLYEYNGKGGVMPSFGSHCTAIGTVSRVNATGFFCGGAATDEGVGTQMTCMSCMTYANTYGYQAGATADEGCSIYLQGCQSIEDGYAIYTLPGSIATACDCHKYGSGGASGGAGTLEVRTGEPIV